jgi:DNA replication protein DnaC
MTNNQTLEKMNNMKLYGMANAFKLIMETGIKNDWTYDEIIGHLIDTEWDDRNNRKINRLIKGARFRTKASVEEIDFSINRNLDKNMIIRLFDCNWINKNNGILITGLTGCGKSFISCALGFQACSHGIKTLYYRVPKLFSMLKLSKADGTYMNKLEKIQKHQLLILDDFGLENLDRENRLSLLEIIEDRYGIGSTIITSQIPVKDWYEIIGDKTIADSILDRIIHNSFRIELNTKESLRKKTTNNLT